MIAATAKNLKIGDSYQHSENEPIFKVQEIVPSKPIFANHAEEAPVLNVRNQFNEWDVVMPDATVIIVDDLGVYQTMKQRGGALLEVALVIPMWVILCFGLIDIIGAYRIYSAADHAAREGVMRGGRFQCSYDHNSGEVKVCDPTRAMPTDSGEKDFLGGPSEEEAILCLDDNRLPDCGRVLMAFASRQVMRSMAPISVKGIGVKVDVSADKKTAKVTVSAQFTPMFKILGPRIISATEIGRYGVTTIG